MGKKSLTKSTSKKKRAPKKTTASAAKTKKTPTKKTTTKAKKTVKKAAPKKTVKKTAAISVKDLLKKKFDRFIPETLYTIPDALKSESTFTAPELLTGFEGKTAEQVKGLLANTYSEKDLIAAAEKAAAEKAAAEKAAAEKAAAEKAAAEKAAAEKAAAEKAAAEKAAAEKAAAEKAAAEKAAAEKAAAEKAAAEKAAAEKAAAEKAAAEKAAAEKAAAEKAAAEKAAAEKAAAEKAAAEKAAAEKAAAEKAAAEKAAAEKAAAEKAAAEKAAAEKAAAEKAAEIKKQASQKSEVSVSYDAPSETSPPKEPSDPIDNSIKLAAAGLAFLILLVIGASASNSFKYYIKENQGALEVWKGKFAPLGEKLVVSLPGTPAPEEPKSVYTSDEVFPMVFQHYIDKADALLDVPGIPDFEGIKDTLKTALEYGSTAELRDLAYQRLDNIDRLVLVYKADVAASRGTPEDLKAAIDYLDDAKKLTIEKSQDVLIVEKISEHQKAIAELEAAAEKAAAEQAAAEAAAAAEAEAEEQATKASEEEVALEETAVEEATETEAETD